MPRRPYAGVAPAQPGLNPVANTSTSADAAPGCTNCVWLAICFFTAGSPNLIGLDKRRKKIALFQAKMVIDFLQYRHSNEQVNFAFGKKLASRHHSRGLRANPSARRLADCSLLWPP
jgi:hypothetical protein